jgi:hypothetical protein
MTAALASELLAWSKQSSSSLFAVEAGFLSPAVLLVVLVGGENVLNEAIHHTPTIKPAAITSTTNQYAHGFFANRFMWLVYQHSNPTSPAKERMLKKRLLKLLFIFTHTLTQLGFEPYDCACSHYARLALPCLCIIW